MKTHLTYKKHQIFVASLLTLLVLCQSACQSSGAIWIIAGSTINNLSFGISESRNSSKKVMLHSIEIFRCTDIHDRGSYGYYPPADRAVWAIECKFGKQKPSTNQFVYGDISLGAKSVYGPQKLDSPGCYVVIAYLIDSYNQPRTATTGFNVATDGVISQMSQLEYERIFSPKRQ